MTIGFAVGALIQIARQPKIFILIRPAILACEEHLASLRSSTIMPKKETKEKRLQPPSNGSLWTPKPSASSPPPELLSMVSVFLWRHGFIATFETLLAERTTRNTHGGLADGPDPDLDDSFPSLITVYTEWRDRLHKGRLPGNREGESEVTARQIGKRSDNRVKQIPPVRRRQASSDSSSQYSRSSAENSDGMAVDLHSTDQETDASDFSTTSSSYGTEESENVPADRGRPRAKSGLSRRLENGKKDRTSHNRSPASLSTTSSSKSIIPTARKANHNIGKNRTGVSLRSSTFLIPKLNPGQSSGEASTGHTKNLKKKALDPPSRSTSSSSSGSPIDPISKFSAPNKTVAANKSHAPERSSAASSSTLTAESSKTVPSDPSSASSTASSDTHSNTSSGSDSSSSAATPVAAPRKPSTTIKRKQSLSPVVTGGTNNSKKVRQAVQPPITSTSVARNAKPQNKPFSRVAHDTQLEKKFESNAYVPYDYAERAHKELAVTKGKGFTKEKNKKKRGSYRGGTIDVQGRKGIKFD